MNSKMTFAATSLLLAGVLAVTYGCASSSEEDNGGSTGNSSSSSGGGGGSSGDGGSSGGGGSSSGAAPSGDAITFASGKAEGLFTGFGWVALGKDDFITDPTCDTDKKAITKDAPCSTTTNWAESGNGKLCMSGKVPALGTPPDYTANWGVQIGVNAKEPSDAIGSAMSDYKTVTFTISGKPASGLRAMFHRKGDDSSTTTYCMDSIKSGKAYNLLDFNTKCWGETGTVKLKAEDLPIIDIVGIQVSSGTAEIPVENLCLEKVEFGK
jgi:hypothetical protein